MGEKLTKENLEELKGCKIDEEALEDVAGGNTPGDFDFLGIKDMTSNPNAKKDRGVLKKYKKIIK